MNCSVQCGVCVCVFKCKWASVKMFNRYHVNLESHTHTLSPIDGNYFISWFVSTICGMKTNQRDCFNNNNNETMSSMHQWFYGKIRALLIVNRLIWRVSINKSCIFLYLYSNHNSSNYANEVKKHSTSTDSWNSFQWLHIYMTVFI